METMAGMHRSCGCGLVTENDCGKELTLAGWVNTRRHRYYRPKGGSKPFCP